MDILAQKLSQTLYEHDPMDTCCKENECFDEYDNIAAQAVELIEDGHSLKTALNTVLSDLFSVDLAQEVDYETIENQFKE